MGMCIDLFKQVMSNQAATVTVVTTRDGAVIHGMTATSFCSVSLDPLLVLVCISKNQRSHDLLSESGVFMVNILSSSQRPLAERFAGIGPCPADRFDGLACQTAITGSPILPDAVAWLDCRVWNSYDGGDHTIFVGEVVDGGLPNNSLPLLYYKRQWASLDMAP